MQVREHPKQHFGRQLVESHLQLRLSSPYRPQARGGMSTSLTVNLVSLVEQCRVGAEADWLDWEAFEAACSHEIGRRCVIWHAATNTRKSPHIDSTCLFHPLEVSELHWRRLDVCQRPWSRYERWHMYVARRAKNTSSDAPRW